MRQSQSRLADTLADRYRIERELGAGGIKQLPISEAVRLAARMAGGVSR